MAAPVPNQSAFAREDRPAQLCAARRSDKKAAMISYETSGRSGRSLPRLRRAAAAAVLAAALSACSSINPFSEDSNDAVADQAVVPSPSIPASTKDEDVSPANQFMWQAALETIGFMPITELDDLTGVIETGWYIPPGAPTERFRANVSFSSRALRAESMSLEVHREQLDDTGKWLEVPVSPSVQTNLVDSILSRALVLRQESGIL